MRFLFLQTVMTFMIVFFNMLQAQDLKGFVKTEQGIPVSNVSVVNQNRVVSKTDVNGLFVLPKGLSLPLNIKLEHPNYQFIKYVFSKTDQIFYLKANIEIEELGEVLISAPLEIKSNSIIPSSTVTSVALDQQSQVAVVDALNKVAGVYIQSGAINTNRITIRGVGSRTLYGTNKIKAYFNGIPITNGVGETALDIYDPEDLQSIEIIKGPKSTLYGTNLGGTILLNSKYPKSNGYSIDNRTTVGSFGLFKNSTSLSFSDENFSLHFNYDHLEMEGYRDNGQYNRNSYFLNSSYKLNDKMQLSLLVNHTNYMAQIPSSIGKTDYLENPSKAAFTWGQAKGYEADKKSLLGINLTYKFSEKFENSTSVFHTYNDHYEPRPFNILDEFTNGFGLRSVFTNNFDFLGRKAVWNFGTEVFKDEFHWKTIENRYASNNGNGSLEGVLLSDNREDRSQLNLFSSVTLPVLEKVTLQVGVNYNKTKYDFLDEFNLEEANKSASRNFDAIVAPNFNMTYQFTPYQQLFANVGYGFNYPSLEETLTPDGVINPEISPEKGCNYEIGSDAYFFNRRWHVMASYYIMDIQDLLVAQRVGDDQYIGRNAGRTLHKGLEISTEYKLVLTDAINISPYFNAAINWHRFKEFINEEIDYSGNELTGVPNISLASGVALNYNKMAFYINHLYVGEMPMNDGNSLYSDAYSLLNLKLDYSAQLFKALKFKVIFGINNLADTKYASSILINATGFGNSEPRYYYPGNPRNYYGGVSLNYRF
ncbi:TonB-dependent receptor family protein [Gelidibacter pelagius]|uniref:TonB-dependent receptor n=1 Tax=Gelidibacter pelagius TaxID=2819985 RepID=A0ABS3SPZ1_9FLAO|nr:TonB-dependent receptor [Gelidibacter pelagius]MBO3097764.1 TonB-dependent receptor [Gelidibacter pelagius]